MIFDIPDRSSAAEAEPQEERTRIYRRDRSNYSSVRKAWADVARASGRTPADVVEPCHTETHFCWRVRVPG